MVSDLEVAQKMVADLQAANQILEARITQMEEPYGAVMGQVGCWLVPGQHIRLASQPRETASRSSDESGEHTLRLAGASLGGCRNALKASADHAGPHQQRCQTARDDVHHASVRVVPQLCGHRRWTGLAPCLQGAPLTTPAGSSSAAGQLGGAFITTTLDELNPQLLSMQAVRDMSAAECGSIWKVRVLGNVEGLRLHQGLGWYSGGSVRHDTCSS